MKKALIMAAAAIGGLFGLNQSVSTGAAGSGQTTIQQGGNGQRAPQTPQQPMRQTDRRSVIHRNIADPFPPYQLAYAGGMDPKSWGQHLQRTGRQKWDKKRA